MKITKQKAIILGCALISLAVVGSSWKFAKGLAFNYWSDNGTWLKPNNSRPLGDSTDRIAKGWFTDFDSSSGTIAAVRITAVTYGNLNVGGSATTTIVGDSTTSTFPGPISASSVGSIGTVTSTWANGINLTKGCFSVGGTCLSSIATPVSVANGGTGAATLASGSVLLGAGTAALSTTSILAVNKGGTGLASAAVGGVLYFESANTVTTTNPGTSKQVLISNGAGTEPTWANAASGKYDVTTADTTVGANSTAVATLYNAVINANDLSTANGIHVHVNVSTLAIAIAGSPSVTIAINFGNVGCASVSIQNTTPRNVDYSAPAFIDAYLYEQAATNSQDCGISVLTSNAGKLLSGPDTGVNVSQGQETGEGTAAVDTTVNQNLAITVQFSTSNASNGVTLTGASMEIIR